MVICIISKKKENKNIWQTALVVLVFDGRCGLTPIHEFECDLCAHKCNSITVRFQFVFPSHDVQVIVQIKGGIISEMTYLEFAFVHHKNLPSQQACVYFLYSLLVRPDMLDSDNVQVKYYTKHIAVGLKQNKLFSRHFAPFSLGLVLWAVHIMCHHVAFWLHC